MQISHWLSSTEMYQGINSLSFYWMKYFVSISTWLRLHNTVRIIPPQKSPCLLKSLKMNLFRTNEKRNMKILHLAAIIAAAAASDFHGKSSAKFFFPAQTVAFRQFPAVCSWSPYPTFSPFEFHVPVARHQVELVFSAPAESTFWRTARVSIKKVFDEWV